uniref:diguanylate cyclase domain-containing protein n=1 Tax=Agathobacter sp. TaxID=2021311 RepID=UPI004024D1AD
MTKQEVEKKIEVYKELFSVVRLLKGEEIEKTQGLKTDGIAGVDAPCQCYSFWKKQHPCDNCISVKALREKTKKTKLEFMDNEVFEVIAKYMEIDGEPYVMELLNRMEEENFVDSMGREKLVEKLTVYNEKLYKDVLTGAYNRLYYEEEVKKRMQTSGVALIDVDDFKLYNDTYGHLTGDMALVTVANAIRKCIRKTDILVRYGGDEFILVLPGVNEDILIRKLQRVQQAIQHASIPGYSRLQLSVSIGGVISSNESIESAVSRADKLMYQAKTEKNMVVTEKNKVSHDGEISLLEQTNRMKPQILIIDNSEINRNLLVQMLEGEYQIIQAGDGEHGMQLLEQYGRKIALVLLNINMQGIDGFEVLSYMNRRQWIEDIPVIMISGEDTETSIRYAYDLGAVDYINSPFDAKIVYQRVTNTIKLYAKQRRLISLITDQINEKEKNNQMMIRILSQIVEFRNGESGSHVLHINKLTEMLLDRLIQKTDQYQLDGQMISMIATASSLHDIGKICVDERILNKPGKLTKEEFEIMKTHAVIGAGMLEHLENYQDEPMIKVAHEICRWHHERYDGNGYPDGLKADEIPISAQVVSVADVYDALVSKRIYKKAFSHEKALQMILNGECGQFNPILIDCLKEISEEIKTEYHE